MGNKYKNKTVTNLLCKIGTARDLIEQKKLNELYKNRALFIDIGDNVTIQVDKFFKNKKHELDFNRYDLQELSDEAYKLLDELATLLRYDGYKKDIYQEKVITKDICDAYSTRWAKLMELDAFIRAMAKKLGYLAVFMEIIEKKEKND